jgi:hypothetical protein
MLDSSGILDEGIVAFGERDDKGTGYCPVSRKLKDMVYNLIRGGNFWSNENE